mmetsp:Transcript_15123/g.34357  ORF Transcript_15123/g.34357 Transcript_15123/m.34357 type:complete len:281 (+) Transcript_15123:157-999(+)
MMRQRCRSKMGRSQPSSIPASCSCTCWPPLLHSASGAEALPGHIVQENFRRHPAPPRRLAGSPSRGHRGYPRQGPAKGTRWRAAGMNQLAPPRTVHWAPQGLRGGHPAPSPPCAQRSPARWPLHAGPDALLRSWTPPPGAAPCADYPPPPSPPAPPRRSRPPRGGRRRPVASALWRQQPRPRAPRRWQRRRPWRTLRCSPGRLAPSQAPQRLESPQRRGLSTGRVPPVRRWLLQRWGPPQQGRLPWQREVPRERRSPRQERPPGGAEDQRPGPPGVSGTS